ncbi:MAG TPA: tetratricopeptide repeat protein [Dongiaceae bacterium]|nr:tetratricopeptide repeat protein [Dongiaceae bacterium]
MSKAVPNRAAGYRPSPSAPCLSGCMSSWQRWRVAGALLVAILLATAGAAGLAIRPAAAVALGGDDRQGVERVKGGIFGPVGLMVLDEGADDAVAGTAFLVSPCHVLTAYHVAGGGGKITDKTVAHFYLGQGSVGPDFDDARQFADETTARPVAWGQYVPNEDDSPAAIRAKAILQNGWEDWALLKLDKCLGDEKTGYGYFHLFPMTTRDLTRKGTGLRISSIGLPGDKPLARLWWDPHCRVVGQVHDSGWQNDCVTVPGNSGGPLLLRPDGEDAAGMDLPTSRPPVVGITIAIIGVDGLENDQSDKLALAKNDPNYYDLLGTAVPIAAVIAKIAPYLPPDPAVSAYLAAHPADEHYTVDKADLAVQDLTSALQILPHSAELYLLRASWEDVRGDADIALADYNKAVDADPNYAPARYLLGQALLRRGDDDPANLDGAVDAFTRILRDFPYSPDVLLYRAFAYRALKQNDKAVEDLTATLAKQPGSEAAVNARGEAYRDLHRDDQALSDFTTAIRLNPQSTDALRDRGFLYHSMARYDLARADFQRVLTLDAGDVEAANGVALCDLSSGAAAKAIDSFSAVIKMAPDVGVYYANRGTAYLLTGDDNKATADFRKALQLEPDEPFDALLLYIAEARSGDRLKAKQELADFAAHWSGPKKDQHDNSSANVETDWPRPMIDFYLGKISLADVTEAAKRGDANDQADQHFDLDFYLGQWALLDGRRDEGRQRLQNVVKTDMREFMEFDIAAGDLNRLLR